MKKNIRTEKNIQIKIIRIKSRRMKKSKPVKSI